MHILFYIHSLSSGGAERVTTTLANHWASQGLQVTVVTVAGRERDFYTLDDRIKRIALSLDANSANPWRALISNGRRVRALRHVLRVMKPDVAVAMMATANVTLALASWGLPIVTIGSERIHPPTLPLGRAWEVIRRWSYPHLSALVAQTQQSADWLHSNTNVAHVEVIANPLQYPLAIHESKMKPSDIMEEIGSSRLLLTVGRLDHQKGFDRLLDVFANISRAYPDWALVILGEGPKRASLEEQVTSLGLGQRVCLPGAVGNVGDWFEAADVYALTSRFEGFPNSLLEALAYGVPSVAVDCETGPREILRHEVNGLLVPQNDNKALASALERLIGDPALRARFAERAIEARERFSIRCIAEQWEKMFNEVKEENDS